MIDYELTRRRRPRRPSGSRGDGRRADRRGRPRASARGCTFRRSVWTRSHQKL